MLLDGRAVNACLVFAAQVDGAVIGTVEGLAATASSTRCRVPPSTLGAVQCGFCTPGMLMTAARPARRGTPSPTRPRCARPWPGSFCRCTGYVKPVEAILAAAAAMLDRQRP